MLSLRPHTRSAALLSIALLAGCSSADERPRAERLAGACQVRPCTCAPAGWSRFSAGGNTPVLWRANGEAYCPEGYRLHYNDPVPPRR